ncbi:MULTISPECIES: hypothetical protein [Dickeya]|uniref:DUF7661 domain-containing protein n=1 Tax=Dickeya fangzhongdai TaxID=1778540 RepID=A0A2K8QGH8_9GAMM|nr:MULTISPECIES: hypothetical protein [Dickeya]ATZ92613.1 hypothetical protein CVE23_00625 [Dickeya fangzhongdai]AYH46331.1 hypothetical protein B6N31_00615 [Dickeya fangzhongdai]MBO8132847.1 hypothetical protein [Dickeya fangzhongdai]QOH46042.1 hypothetical protein DYD82_00655 [Dickeya fangzhongdai]QOH50350.1 hypothetical protein DYD83_00665 [Dickeya fangzhongdai]
MLIYNVFGRIIGVKRHQQQWQVFRIDLNERKHSPLHGVVIPDDATEEEIPVWLDDIFHEAASDKYPQVFRIE